MAQLASDTFTGSNGAAWSATWGLGNTPSGGSAAIQGNAGRLTTGTTGGYAGASYVSRRVVITSPADVVWTSRVRFIGDEIYPIIYLRSTSTQFDGASGYALNLNGAGGNYSIDSVIGYSATNILADTTWTFTTNSWYWVRFGIVGSALKMKIWADGGGEPAWLHEFTNTAITAAGNVGIRSGAGNIGLGKFEIDDLSVDTSFPSSTATVTGASTAGRTITAARFESRTVTGAATAAHTDTVARSDDRTVTGAVTASATPTAVRSELGTITGAATAAGVVTGSTTDLLRQVDGPSTADGTVTVTREDACAVTGTATGGLSTTTARADDGTVTGLVTAGGNVTAVREGTGGITGAVTAAFSSTVSVEFTKTVTGETTASATATAYVPLFADVVGAAVAEAAFTVDAATFASVIGASRARGNVRASTFVLFTTPWIRERRWRRRHGLWDRMYLDRGVSILRYGASVQQIDNPSTEEMETADAVYIGGRIYRISFAEADLLRAAGYGAWLDIYIDPGPDPDNPTDPGFDYSQYGVGTFGTGPYGD